MSFTLFEATLSNINLKIKKYNKMGEINQVPHLNHSISFRRCIIYVQSILYIYKKKTSIFFGLLCFSSTCLFNLPEGSMFKTLHTNSLSNKQAIAFCKWIQFIAPRNHAFQPQRASRSEHAMAHVCVKHSH